MTTLGLYNPSRIILCSQGSWTQSSLPYILVYVDDMVITGTFQKQIDIVKHALDDAFTIKDLGNIKYFIKVIISSSGTIPRRSIS